MTSTFVAVNAPNNTTILTSSINRAYVYVADRVKNLTPDQSRNITCYTFIQATSTYTLNIEGYSAVGQLFTRVSNTAPTVSENVMTIDGVDFSTSASQEYLRNNGFDDVVEGNSDNLDATIHEIDVAAGQWFVTAFNINSYETLLAVGVMLGVPFGNGTCFVGCSMVTMGDGSLKRIDEIKRGDVVLENAFTGKTNVVANMYESVLMNVGYRIPSGLIGNVGDIVCTNHPIVCNDGKNRIYPSDIPGVLRQAICEPIYDIQFEDEGTFYVNGIMVDSLSPHNEFTNLAKSLYYNTEKFVKRVVTQEDDPVRNKPPMTMHFVNAVGA